MTSKHYAASRKSIVADVDYYELPEVLRFNKYGGVMSPLERDRVAKSKGLCNKCGKVTHKVTALRSIPLNNSDVKNGVCLLCHPEEQGLSQRNGNKKRGSLRFIRDAGTKANKLLGDEALPQAPTKKGGRKNRRVEFSDAVSHHKLPKDATLGKSTWRRKKMFAQHMNSSFNLGGQTTASAFSHGGVVPSKDSADVDPLRLMKLSNKMMATQRNISRKAIVKIQHDFSAPKNNEDAWDIVKEMRENPNDIELLIRKCHELRSIGTNSAGALYEIIEVMRRHPQDRNLQFAAIGALWSVSADGDDDSKAEAIDAGAAMVIIDAVTFFPGDVNLVCWGIGALSSFAEGITGRGSLINSGAFDTLETVLEKYYKAESKVACAICYWVFRCLLLMVVSYEDYHASMMNSMMMSDVRSDRDKLAMFIKTLSKHNIVHLVVSAMGSSSMDSMTLSTAFNFLIHIPGERYKDDEWEILSKVVPPVIQEKSYASYPVTRMIAFKMLCELMTNESALPLLLSATSVAIREALVRLLPRRVSSLRRASLESRSGDEYLYEPPTHIVQDIMLCTLSHTLTYTCTELRFSESKTALKTASSILEFQRNSMFSKISCCWIIFGVLRRSDTIKNTSFAKQAAQRIQSAMIIHQDSPHLLTIGFAALSAAGVGITHVKALVDLVLGLKSSFPNEKSLLKEACRFLGNCCETKESADYILSAGGLDLAMSLLKDEEKYADDSGEYNFADDHKEKKPQGREAVHLVYKFVLFSGAHVLTLDKCHAIFDVRDLAKDNILLAAEMVYVLTKAVTVTSDSFNKSILQKRKSVRELKRNDNEGIFYPIAETFMFFDFIVEVTEVFGHNRNFMKCACLAIKNISITAKRAKLQLGVERPILVIQKSLVHLKGLHAPVDAIWALLGVKHSPLARETMRDVAQSMISCIEGSMGIHGHQFLESIVHASLAVLSSIFLESKIVLAKKDLLGPEIVEKVVELVLAIFFSCLDKYGNFPSIFSHGFHMLQSLCDDSSYRSIIIKHGGVVAVVDAMMTNMENAAILKSGCIILRYLSESDNVSKINVVEADGLELLLDIVTTPDIDLNVIEEAMLAILSLSLGEKSRLVLEQEGGISAICEVMAKCPRSELVQETGLAVLCFLASDVDDSFLEEIPIFGTVRNSLSEHQDNVSIYQNGFALLEMLSLKSDASRSMIVSSGCIDCVAKAIMSKRYPSKTVGSAFEVLVKVMTSSKECREMIVKHEMMEAIIFSMMLHIECYKIQLDGCRLLYELCKQVDNSRLVKAGGVKATLCAMMVHNMSEGIQLLACTILISVLSSDPACLDNGSSESRLREKITEALEMAKDNFPGSQLVQANGTTALKKLSQGQNGLPPLV